MKIRPQDFKYEVWQRVAQAIEDGQGVNALLLFCKDHGNEADNYRMPVQSVKTITNAAEAREAKSS